MGGTVCDDALRFFLTHAPASRWNRLIHCCSTIFRASPTAVCSSANVLIGLTRWVRLRLRAALWRQWKTPRRRRAALLELGVRGPLASNTAGSGRGPWYLARAKALSVGLSNAYFKSLGLPSLFEEC